MLRRKLPEKWLGMERRTVIHFKPVKLEMLLRPRGRAVKETVKPMRLFLRDEVWVEVIHL